MSPLWEILPGRKERPDREPPPGRKERPGQEATAGQEDARGQEDDSDEENVTVRKVYLTFDDGPSSNTDNILDILDTYGVKATFSRNGKRGRESRSLLPQDCGGRAYTGDAFLHP